MIMFNLCEGVDLTDCWPFRDKLRAEARQLSAHSSVSKRTAIATSRQKLGRKIEAFHAKGSAFLGDISDGGDDISLEQIDCEEDNILDVGDEFDDFPDDSIPSDASSDEGSNDDEEEEEEEMAENPEGLRLAMPSSLGRECIVRIGLEALATQELELRKGQANDALEDLRLALGHKALLWRTKVRTAKNNKECTRAWDDIKTARRQVEKNVRHYHRAWRALVALGADETIMTQYKVIGTNDLRLSGDVLDPSRLGQRNDTLAWFWRLGTNNSDQDNSWMEECKSLSCSGSDTLKKCLPFHAVYRVNFLRAKARYDRWDEELKIVQHEMQWCVLYFEHQMEIWGERAQAATREGPRAYAHKQVAMWQKFAIDGQNRFNGKTV